MYQVWQQLLNKIQPGDEVAVFFSGHGVEIEGGNFLIPRDVPAVARWLRGNGFT
jgi:uncharacterized caspase-like protein